MSPMDLARQRLDLNLVVIVMIYCFPFYYCNSEEFSYLHPQNLAEHMRYALYGNLNKYLVIG